MADYYDELELLDERFKYAGRSFIHNYSSFPHVTRNLTRTTVIEGHDGCVNTVCWSEDGSLLLSGSDDSTLQIYKYGSYEQSHKLSTGHRGIIFTARFFPHTKNAKIVSGENHGMVRVTDVARPEESVAFMCNKGAVYQVIATSPNVFYSCGYDRSVREYDLREESSCDCRRGSCHRSVLLKGKTQVITAMAFNPLKDYEFAIAIGTTIRLYDSRRLKRHRGLLSGEQRHGCVAEYDLSFGARSKKSAPNERVTFLNYNHNGSEVVVNTRVGGVILLSSEHLDHIASLPSHPLDENMPSTSAGTSGTARPGGVAGSSGDGPPVRVPKRLRICGDWSDTGPNARPNTSPGSQTNAERFISQVVTRWLNQRMTAVADQNDDSDSESSEHESESESESVESMLGDEGEGERRRLVLLNKFTGHRNTRTMIKQANFWGTSHILSGSDCGRIFIWDRHTLKPCVLLTGDRRVVNTVQPHPFDPVLATSGIDHNIKIWSPCPADDREEWEREEEEEEGSGLRLLDEHAIEEVVRCNQEMLSEIRDTVSIPTTVMLRVLSMLNQSGNVPGVEPPGPL